MQSFDVSGPPYLSVVCVQVVHFVFQYLKMLQNLGPQQRSGFTTTHTLITLKTTFLMFP